MFKYVSRRGRRDLSDRSAASSQRKCKASTTSIRLLISPGRMTTNVSYFPVSAPYAATYSHSFSLLSISDESASHMDRTGAEPSGFLTNDRREEQAPPQVQGMYSVCRGVFAIVSDMPHRGASTHELLREDRQCGRKQWSRRTDRSINGMSIVSISPSAKSKQAELVTACQTVTHLIKVTHPLF